MAGGLRAENKIACELSPQGPAGDCPFHHLADRARPGEEADPRRSTKEDLADLRLLVLRSFFLSKDFLGLGLLSVFDVEENKQTKNTKTKIRNKTRLLS